MGNRLRKLKVLRGEKKVSDGKTIGGKGRLTDAIISKLTTFYGNAIRANSHNVNEMRQAVYLCGLIHPAQMMSRNIGFTQKAKIAGVSTMFRFTTIQ
ncbi:hypothetical protein TNCV_1112091 [Trichonephila clavipes]|uniref:Uncharacterized protein n=1 Tax=Trichonephila clavipes TaxID=2585209 RepID=A0A8X6V213_TRICX|nr:hypothetical protein TNCV_1112091 [Trichonephila clavipes]